MRRREFIAGLGSTAAWPLAARAQQGNRVRRIGVLVRSDDASTKVALAAFTQELRDLGWTDGHNMRIEFRGGAGNPDQIRMFAKELVDLQPDVILVGGFAAAKAAQQQTHTIPLVFAGVGDPVSGGLVASISHPEGNSTGITNLFPSVAGKWLELLKEFAPRVARVALVFNPELSSGTYFASIEAAAAQYAVTAIRAPVRNAAEIDRAVEAFAAEPNGGLMVLPPLRDDSDFKLINQLALRHRLPTIYSSRLAVIAGALMSYGTGDLIYRQAASYVDRILRGAKVSELPVQFPTKFELVVNLKTAKAIGLEIPATLLARADEVIE
jgi:putative ABC transport system substrate-binding protein